MSAPTELWKKWEGRVVNEKFPLQRWLGGSDHSAVFLTERPGKQPQKAVVKLISAENLRQENQYEDSQLARWTAAARLSHPHLIRLFECGRCLIDDTRLLYVVMEYADEILAQILPLRPLSPAEASEMLRPTAKALTALHQAGLAHARIKPSNIMAAGNQLKLSIDGLRKIGERGGRSTSAYDAPEIATAAWSPAADIWSLGMTLVAVLTQNEPKLKTGDEVRVAIPETIPQPFREIARQCLQVDPRRRCTLGDILSQLPMPGATEAAKMVEAQKEQQRPKRWIVVLIVVAALFLGALVGGKFILRQASTPAAQSRPTFQVPAGVPAAQSPAPFSSKEASGQKGVARGSVLQQVLPDVSLSAQNTIEGRIRVSVQVAVDASGNVSEANLVSPGPSKYFANRALAAARRWKFNPPQVAGQAAASEWVLRFQFQRTSTQVFPAEIKP